MDKTLKDSLVLLDLTVLEIKFFEACFLLGNPSISEVIKSARLERSTGYLIASELIKKGFIKEDYKEYKKRLSTVEPSTLLRMLSAKQRTIGRKELEFKEKLPELQAVHQATTVRPKVRVFEGVKGLLSIWNDILSDKQEILLWSNQETESKFFSSQYHEQFITQRIQKAIPIRVLAVNNDKGKELTKNDLESFRTTKLLPVDTIFSSETYIYGNKIAVIDFNQEIVGVITESEQIANAQRAIFEMSWSTIK